MDRALDNMLIYLNIEPRLIGDIIIGNVLQPGAGAYSARIGQEWAQIPMTVPIQTINRLCSSGIEAIAMVAAKIKAGQINCGIGGGMENMTMFEMKDFVPVDKLTKKAFENELTRDCLLTTGEVAEKCAALFKYTRE